MKLRNILFVLFATITSCVYAGDMHKASANYVAGDYSGAIEEYESVLAQGQESATLYYNLGNAYFRNGNNTKAILNYERALKLDPTDADIRHNLEFAKEKTVDKIDTPEVMFMERWWGSVRNIASADTWSYSSIGIFALFIAALLCYVLTGNIALKKASFSISIIALVFSILTCVLAYQQNAIQSDNTAAIVLSPTVTLKSTPDVSGTDLFILHEGTKVRIMEYVGSWIQIETEDGSKGWMNVNGVEVI